MGQFSLNTLRVYFHCIAYGLIIMWDEIMRIHCCVRQVIFSSLKLWEWCMFSVTWQEIIFFCLLYPNRSLTLISLILFRKQQKVIKKTPQFWSVLHLRSNRMHNPPAHSWWGILWCDPSSVILSPFVLNWAEQRRTRAASSLSCQSCDWDQPYCSDWENRPLQQKIPSKGTRTAAFIQPSSHICLH